MKTILLIGIGTGNPEHLTVQAINAMARADRLFIPDKGAGKADLAELRRDIIARYCGDAATRIVAYTVPRRNAADPDYAGGVEDWHDALTTIFAGLLTHLPTDGTGAFLVWGDPGLYDSTIRILHRLQSRYDLAVEIIPGITAIQALTAAHGIPLNRVGQSVHITPARRLEPVETDTVVMLDGQTAFLSAHPDLEIFWGAFLGMPEQITIAGRLGDVRDQIVEARKAARAQHGWIMDTYLLRRRE
jgi:precorrin-6A synthase